MLSNEENERRLYSDNTAYREAVMEWLRANGVDPAQVPVLERGHIQDGQLFLMLYVSNRIDPASNDREARSMKFPVKVEPTGVVVDWLTWDGR